MNKCITVKIVVDYWDEAANGRDGIGEITIEVPRTYIRKCTADAVFTAAEKCRNASERIISRLPRPKKVERAE